MGKKKSKGEYNDFLDGEKLTDNTEIRTTLQNFATRDIPQRTTQSTKPIKGAPNKKPPLTHFLCLPLVTPESRPQLQTALSTLKNSLSNDPIIPPKAVRPTGTLHLTLGVMSLTPPDLRTAISYLHSLDLHILLRDITHLVTASRAAEAGAIAENLAAASMPDTDSLTLSLESLVPMQDPAKTSILYAEPKDKSGRLGAFAKEVKEQFEKEGLLVEDKRELRLHATVLNTVYAKGRGKGRHEEKGRDGKDDAVSVDDKPTAVPDPSTAETMPRSKGKSGILKFDARELIEQYKGFVWAEGVRVDRVQICKMGATKILNEEGEVLDEVYEVVAQKEIL